MSYKNRKRACVRPLARGAVLLAVAGAVSACSLDLVNPNAPQEDEVLSSPELVLTTAVGIQSQYADNVLIFVRAPELVTDQWGTRPLALAADQALVTGTVDPTFGVVSAPFAATYRIARSADVLVQSTPGVGLSPGLQTGISALSKLLKAMALGHLTTQYERLPANFSAEGAAPLPRAEVRDTVIAILESARAELQGVSDADLATFRSRVLNPTSGTGIDLRNTVDAMLARYYLFDGQYPNALAAAARVNPASLSLLQYPNPSANPIWSYGLSARYVGARKEFFTEAEAGDQRPNFWAIRTPATGTTGRPDSVYDFRSYGGNRSDPYPLYLPDEMKLIQAEAHARGGNLGEARRLINQVRTQGRNATTGVCTAPVGGSEPIACLPALSDAALATQAQILRQILYERRYELFGQGVRWEDLRRLREFTAERPSIEFLPYPESECERNPNAGC